MLVLRCVVLFLKFILAASIETNIPHYVNSLTSLQFSTPQASESVNWISALQDDNEVHQISEIQRMGDIQMMDNYNIGYSNNNAAYAVSSNGEASLDKGSSVLQNSVAFSALGLLGFLFLLRLITDTMTNAGNLRTGRSIKYDSNEKDEMSWLSLGKDVINLYINVLEEKKLGCFCNSLCETNRFLVSRHGEMGKMAGTFVSDFINSYMYGDDQPVQKIIKEATKTGQANGDCSHHYGQYCAT